MYPEAGMNYTEALRYAEMSGSALAIAEANNTLGSLYLKIAENDKAFHHFLTAVEISRKNEDGINEALASMKIAEIYINRGKTLSALEWLNQAEIVVPKTAFYYLEDIYMMIAQAYIELEDFENAANILLLHSQVKDSLVVAENLEKITTLTNRLEFENKQALQNESHEKMMQIKQKEIERQKVVRNFSLFGAFVILVLAIIFFIRFVEKKKLNNALNQTLANLKSTQVQLIHAEKMASLGELTAGIAHEIQNPLNFIKNFAEVNSELITELNEEIEKGNYEEVKTIAQDINDNEKKIIIHGQRADGIVKGMLQHSRKSNNEKIPTDINKLADEYLRLSYHGIRAKDKSFNADYKTLPDYSLPHVRVIPQDIGRVLLNLVNNAFFTVSEKAKQNNDGYKPMVVVGTRNLIDKVEISVKDNGGGIPEKIRDKIFQPFFTTKAAGEGTGLGLSLSYDIITKGHGGELIVETKEGEGTEFKIVLPYYTES
jgi:signal transduction histidine kinase